MPKGAASSHRGPGSLALNHSGAITPAGSRNGTPEPSVCRSITSVWAFVARSKVFAAILNY